MACTEKVCACNCDFVKNFKAMPISQVPFYSDAAISKYRRDDSVSLSNNPPTDTQVNVAVSKLAALKRNQYCCNVLLSIVTALSLLLSLKQEQNFYVPS